MNLRELPTRVATGAFILHSGIDKWRGDEATAAAIHGMASGTYPFLKSIPPERFLRMLAAGEILTGTTLLAPFVPTALAGAALTAFSGALIGLYLRTPGMRKPGSIWPTQQGIAVSKDIWMVGIGLGLIFDGITDRADDARGEIED
ncbi:MAG TPA: hypothetical protein VMB82_04075 [Acidimicrobiales bacterium]|nr:hypothetical protein [Acidimicrobiales bacterium]